MITLLLSCRA